MLIIWIFALLSVQRCSYFFQLCFMILLPNCPGSQLSIFEGHFIYCQAPFPFSTSVTEDLCINRHVLNYLSGSPTHLLQIHVSWEIRLGPTCRFSTFAMVDGIRVGDLY